MARGCRGGGSALIDLGALREAAAATAAHVADGGAEACALVVGADRMAERVEEYREAGVDRPLLPRLPTSRPSPARSP